NNIANSGTVGFKGANAQFADIYAASLNGTAASQGGIGTNVSAEAQLFTQGNLTTSNDPLDLAINGGGFYRVSDHTGASAGAASWSGRGASPVGIGPNVPGVSELCTQGHLATTHNPLDLAISGGGFCRVSDQTGASAGTVSYTRNGQFLLNKDGYVVTAAGLS